MSTILDALRKVEEEKRIQEADVRTRLLSNSTPRFDFRTRRQSRMPWIIGGGLVLVGTLLGAGVMMLRTSGPASEEAAVASSTTTTSTPPVASVSPQQPVTSVPPPPNPASSQTYGADMIGQAPDDARRTAEVVKQPRQVQITPNAPRIVLPKEPRIPPPVSPGARPSVGASKDLGVAEASPQYDPWAGGNSQAVVVENNVGRRGGTPPATAGVQRSPFVNDSPYDRIVAPPTPPPPSASRVTTAGKALQRALVPEEKRSKPAPAAVRRSETVQNATPSRAASSPSAGQANAGEPPLGASLSFLQWSADPEKRVASIKVGTGPAMLAHEGDSIEGLTVEKIRPDAVELRSGESRYLLKAR